MDRRSFCLSAAAATLAASRTSALAALAPPAPANGPLITLNEIEAIDRERILRAANEYLPEPSITITASSSPRSKGGKHDYFSEADYFWPDPKNPNGPYIERDGYSAAVINPRFVKPLDREMLELYARRVTAFVTFEDHVKMGGFGSAVVETLKELGCEVPVVRIGWPDQFIEHGKVDDLRAKYGLSVDSALAQVLPLLAGRRRPALVAS